MSEPTVRFRYPPVLCPITGNFGDWYGSYQHRGTDFGCVEGTYVRAPASGLIVAPYNDGSFGIAVCIQHSDGWHTLYAHLSQALVTPGDWVDVGALIGLSGNTGMSTGPHLHWQLSDSYRFLVDINHSRDAMAYIRPDEEEEDMTALEDLMLAAYSGQEEAHLSREERLTNARYRISAAANGPVEPNQVDRSLSQRIDNISIASYHTHGLETNTSGPRYLQGAKTMMLEPDPDSPDPDEPDPDDPEEDEDD